MNEFRSQLPFGEDVLAEVRKNVMTRVTRPRPWLAVWSLAATAAAIAVIVMLVIPRPRRAVLRTAAIAPPVRSLVSDRATGPITAGADARSPKQQHHRVHHGAPAVAEAPVRIELQTSDPDVRIIWISDRRNHEESDNDVVRPAAGDDRGSR